MNLAPRWLFNVPQSHLLQCLANCEHNRGPRPCRTGYLHNEISHLCITFSACLNIHVASNIDYSHAPPDHHSYPPLPSTTKPPPLNNHHQATTAGPHHRTTPPNHTAEPPLKYKLWNHALPHHYTSRLTDRQLHRHQLLDVGLHQQSSKSRMATCAA